MMDFSDDLSKDDEDLETLKILNEQMEKETPKTKIPIPETLQIKDYEKLVPKDYVRPTSYLRYKAATEKELDETIEYEMDDEDLDFVTKKLPAQKLSIKEDKFEQIIDRLEKESNKIGKMCEMAVLETYKLGGGKVVNAVFNYWVTKRGRLGKPLVRRFQPPTSINDTSPHSTFRPREKEEKRIRRTRKNDKDAHKKLKNLQEDFRRARDLLERVVRREKTKNVLLELDFCLQFAKDIRDVPAAIIQKHEAFMREMMREKQRQRELKKASEEGNALEPLSGAVANQRARQLAARNPGMPGEEEAQPDALIAPEKAQGIKACFQHLMRAWDPERDGPGNSVLPVTSDYKFCTASQFESGVQLLFRGRARVGRGGRVIFDRLAPNAHRGHDSDDDTVGSKRSRGWGGERVGVVWHEMLASRVVRRGGVRCDWGFVKGAASANGFHEAEGAVKLSSLNGPLDGKRKKLANGDVQKQTLGALSGMWGMERQALPQVMWQSLGGNVVDSSTRGLGGSIPNGPLVNKRLKGLEDDAGCAASSASTTAGGLD
jgi:hypothetical protein